jgi:hypothetical protein
MEHPPQVIGPADDAARFFQPRGLVFVTMLWVIAAAWAVCRGLYLLILLAFGIQPTAGDIVTIAESLLLVPAIGAAVILLAAWNSFGWLRTSVHTLEFAATGRRAISLYRTRGDAHDHGRGHRDARAGPPAADAPPGQRGRLPGRRGADVARPGDAARRTAPPDPGEGLKIHSWRRSVRGADRSSRRHRAGAHLTAALALPGA